MQVVQPVRDAGQIAGAVSVGILETAGIDLIHHSFLPPCFFIYFLLVHKWCTGARWTRCSCKAVFRYFLAGECLPYLEKSIRWLQEQDEDGDCFPSGYGIIEIAGLNMEMIDTAVYTCEAYGCFARMLEQAGRKTVVRHFFGIDPRASEGRIPLNPRMPQPWQAAPLENLRVLDGTLDGRMRIPATECA